MARGIIPSLSTDGFIDQGNMIMNKLFEYFLASDYSQSNNFIGTIKSLKYLLSANMKPNDLANKVKEALYLLYSNYFDNVSVTCDVISEDRAKYRIYIEIKGDRDGNRHTLSKELKSTDNKIDNFENEIDKLYQYYGSNTN